MFMIFCHRPLLNGIYKNKKYVIHLTTKVASILALFNKKIPNNWSEFLVLRFFSSENTA